jgi:hypothetical protein
VQCSDLTRKINRKPQKITMETWMLGPPLLIGEKVFYTKHGFIANGTVKWLGRLQEDFGNQMVAGILMVRNKDL